MDGQAVHPRAEDHSPQRHGLPRQPCRQAVPRLSALRGQAQNHRGRHRHQRQDHGVQHAQRHSGGRRPPRAEQPRRQQHRLRRVHRLHPELRPAGPREKVRHGGAGGRRALRPQNLPLCEAGLHRGHQSVPRLHHAQRPPRLHRGHPDPLLPQIVQADFECRRSDLLLRGAGEPPGLLRHRPPAHRCDGVREPAERHAHLPPLRRSAAL